MLDKKQKRLAAEKRENIPSLDQARPSPSSMRLFRGLPRGIWALGFVSMFMDTSSELIHSLLPVFMSSVLGASMTTIGFIEGSAEAVAAITKVFSGAISDYLGKRKLPAVIGYGLAALTKPIFPLAGTIGWVFGARFVDRIGKGIRGAPRDALVADIAPPERRGAAFGLRQSLDSVGAFVGPLIALGCMLLSAGDIRRVLWVAVLPAFVAVAVLFVGVRDPVAAGGRVNRESRLKPADVKRLPLRYWLVVSLGAVFTLARFSEAFLVLRVRDVGLPLPYVPLVLIAMNVFYTATAYPAGVVADRFSRRVPLFAGMVVLVGADLLLSIAASPALVFIGAALWGLHMGLTQGLFSKLVADTAPATLRGIAFGNFNLMTGAALLLSNFIAGALWTAFGAAASFRAGALFAALAALGLIVYRKKNHTHRESGRPESP